MHSEDPRVATANGVNRGQALFLLVLTGLVVSANGGIIAPLIVEIADDFNNPVALVAQLAAITTFVWAIEAPLMGTLTDRYGRKPAIFLGLVTIGVFCLAAGFTWDYASLFVCRLLVGVGAGAAAPTLMAATGDLFTLKERGRAMSTIHIGLILGILGGGAVLAYEAQMLGWRASFITLGLLTLLVAVIVALFFPQIKPRGTSSSLRANLASAAKTTGVAPFLSANVLHESSYALVVTYLPAFLILSYGLSTGDVAPMVAILAVGTLLGNFIGGQMADRGWQLPLCALAPLILGVLAMPLFLLAPDLRLTVGLGAFTVFFWGLARPSYSALAAELSSKSRGAMMGFNATSNQLGDTIGPALGGAILVVAGYSGIGMASIILGFAASLVAQLLLRPRLASLTVRRAESE